MREITIVSGKGGTGKTSIAGSFAVLARNHVIADCDVDAANLHLLLAPKIEQRKEFAGMPRVEIISEKCSGCGICQELCRYGAISADRVNDELSCEGCQVCYNACPEGAIRLVENVAGELYVSRTSFGSFVHARLGVAQDNSGKLVTQVRQQARLLAQVQGKELILTDGPPGIGCPAISALGGTDLALVVAEPTLASIHDLDRIIQLTEHFKVKTVVCINKWDLNHQNSLTIEAICRDRCIPLVGKISYEPIFVAAAREGKPIIQMISKVNDEIVALWSCVHRELSI